jgi:hypothetical protein
MAKNLAVAPSSLIPEGVDVTVPSSTLAISLLIAAERMGRRTFLMEIDPAYCDVIVTRWQNRNGNKASG